MQRKTVRRIGITFGALVVAVAALIWFWNWDWFIPLVDSYASSTLGRKVTISHLHVRLGRVTEVAADNVKIADPDGFPQGKDFLDADRLVVDADVMAYIRHRQIVVPLIEVDKPVVDAEQQPDGKASWDFTLNPGKTPPANNSASKDSTAPSPQIGNLRIVDGQAHVVDPKVKADFDLAVHTNDPKGDQLGQIVVDAKGRYANQPVTGSFIGGALLTLRDSDKPYPVDLHVANGPTKVALTGTLTDPIKFAGANLKLEFTGPDMALLFPLTGVPIPETPAYSIAGNLDYADRKVKFQHFAGRVGSSDLNGEIDVDPTGAKPVVDADLVSHKVDLTDLGGFIGETPGRKNAPTEPPAQKRELAQKEASGRFLPDQPINMPKVEAANVHLRYKGERIEGRSVPLDNIAVALDIDDGRIRLHPLSFAVGKGEIVGNIDLTPEKRDIHATADVDFKRLDLSRIMDATHVFHGQGIVGGQMKINTTGNSISTFMGNGDGEMKVFVEGGGDLSALLTDLVGLQLGDAVLSALGVPNRANLECFVSDFSLVRGDLQTRVFLLNTSENEVLGKGSLNFKSETLDFTLSTKARRFTVGSLPTPIDIRGTLSSPSVKPEIAPLAERGGAAIALGVLFPPLALLPTIQLGVGNDGACSKAVNAADQGSGPPLPASASRHH